MSLAAHTPLLAAMAREVRRVAGSPLQVMLMVVLPFASAWWLLAIFAEPLPRDLPLALVDLDRSQASSTVARMLDDTPTIRVSVEAPSIADAERLVRTGAVYGLVAFPAGFGSAAVRGEAPAVSVFYNTQWLLAASLVARDAHAAVLTASAGAELGAQQARGVPRPARAPPRTRWVRARRGSRRPRRRCAHRPAGSVFQPCPSLTPPTPSRRPNRA